MRVAYSLLLTSTLILLSPASGVAQSISHTLDPAISKSYWTAERIANARPATPVLDGQPAPVSSLPDGTFVNPISPPGAVRSSAKGGNLLLELSEQEMLDVFAGPSPALQVYSYPPPENTWPVPVSWYGSFPLRTVGKVFFSQNGLNFVCSGSSIGNRSVLLAAHCLSDGAGNFSSNVQFVPALRNALRPFGTWNAVTLRVMTAFHLFGELCRDYGFFTTSNQGGFTLSQTVGFLGHAWNQSPLQHWTGLGYPAEAPWAGTIIVATDASFSRDDSPGGCTPLTMGMGTRQTRGTSGGPWVMTYRPQQAGANNFANGVMSYFYTGLENEIFSPYFDDVIKTALDNSFNDF